MKGLIHKHDLRIYRQDLQICFHKETFGNRLGVDMSNANGMVHRNLETGVISLYVPKNETGGIPVATLSHEVFHMADFIFERTGMEIQDGTGNEHMAYLIGYLTDVVFDCLDLDNKMEFGDD